MRVAVTGGTGLVGHFIVEALAARGDDVICLGRSAPRRPGLRHLFYELGAPAPRDLGGAEALVHAALSHLPGRYRGGEGTDPDGFLRCNLHGTLRLFEAARRAGVRRVVFLSSRAVYGARPPGVTLREETSPAPRTLYGRVKFEAEQALASLAGAGFSAASLRATGVHGPPPPGRAHKWQDLFERFARGDAIESHIGTELHGADLADAVLRLLDADTLPGEIFNASDFALDRRHLLALYGALSGTRGRLPPPGNPASLGIMDTARLCALDWRPRGSDAFPTTLADMIAPREDRGS